MYSLLDKSSVKMKLIKHAFYIFFSDFPGEYDRICKKQVSSEDLNSQSPWIRIFTQEFAD